MVKSLLGEATAVAAELAGLDQVTAVPFTQLFVSTPRQIVAERGSLAGKASSPPTPRGPRRKHRPGSGAC